MNWRRIFDVMKVRIGMIAVVLFTLILIRAGALTGQEVKAENMVLNADSEMPHKKPWVRTPVRYAGEYSAAMGILDSENTIFYQDFYKDYHFPYPRGINYFIAVCPQDSLEDYFNQAYLYASGEPTSELNRKDIYCMFYDDRTCNMGKEELEILFLQNGYELSICEGECKGYQVRFYQYGRKDSDRWLYPRHIIMQTWDGGNVYVQDITSDMQRKVMNFISVDDRENPLIILHSTAMTREGVPEEELLFWEFDGNCWSLVPLELEIECFMKNARGKIEPGRIEDFNPIYYKDGIAFRTAVYVEDEYEIVSYLKLCEMREINKNKTFQFALYEESYDYMNLQRSDGWVNFEIVSFTQEPEKEDYASETDIETESETAGRIRSTVIGDVEILEKSLQTTIEVEGWSRVRTWDLKYPYFSGDQVVLLREINNQIYEWVQDRNMDDSEELYYTELTYEITYMDERFVSILFEGEGDGNSYYGYSHGMSFDLKTGELLSLTDFYEWPEWKDLMQNAMEQGQLSTQILRGYMELEEDENREYLEEYFIPLFQDDSDLKKDNLDFYIKDGYLYFITHAYPSCREDSYVKWEDKKDDLEEQGEEKTPFMSGEEFAKITECLDEQVPEIWDEWADYIREQSRGEAHLMERMAGEYLPDDVYRDYEEAEYLGKYYCVYVGETWEDHSIVWAYFYVSEDFSEVLWYDLAQGMDSEYPVLYLDEWRNSDHYPKLEK